MTKRQTFGDRMAVLKNARHERFAQLVAEGETQEAAYRLAGYKPSRQNASTLRTNQTVQVRIAQLQASAAAATEFTLADMLAQVDEDRAFARENMQPAAAISASALSAKLRGMITDKVQASTTVRDERQMDDDELTHIARSGGDGVAEASRGSDRLN